MAVRLITLGTLKLIRDGQEVTLSHQRRVRIALFVYLAIEREANRDKLIGLFWPESPDDNARHSLSQAIYELRQVLGDDALLVVGDRIRALPSTHTDLEQFEQAAAEGEAGEALDLYGGAFLSNVDNLPNSKPFEAWVDARRAHAERLHRSLRRTQIAAATSTGDYESAIEHARAWIGVSPAEDEAHHKLIELLATGGYPSEAIRHYESYARQLAVEDLEPLDETKALVASLERRDLKISVPSNGSGRPALEPPRQGSVVTHAQHPQQSKSLAFRRAARLTALATASLALILIVVLAWRRSAPDLDNDLIAILPFETAGTDSAAASLREGITHLLSTKLAATGIAQSTDPRATINRWTQYQGRVAPGANSHVEFARELGARRVLTGSAIETMELLTLSASLTDVRSKKVRTATVNGPRARIQSLLDELSAKVLGLAIEERDDQLGSLTTPSADALEAYFRGMVVWRTGEAGQAAAYFERALDLDSTFALAGLRLATLGQYDDVGGYGPAVRGLRLAWRARHRLSEPDRVYLGTLAGPRYPRMAWEKERIVATREALKHFPLMTELWDNLGDLLYHAGYLVGEHDPLGEARNAFLRAFAVDSVLYAPRGHLAAIAEFQRDTALQRRLTELWLRGHPQGPLVPFWRWALALSTNDQRALEAIRREFENVDVGVLYSIVDYAHMHGVGIDDADRAISIVKQRRDRGYDIYALERALNAGHHSEAVRLVEEQQQRANKSAAWMLGNRRGWAFFLGIPADDVQPLLTTWEREVEAAGSVVPETEPERERFLAERCGWGLWRLHNGDREDVQEAIKIFRQVKIGASEPPETERRVAWCPLLLQAALEVRPGYRSLALEQLDSVSHLGLRTPINVMVARLWEKQGDPKRALAAVRRRWYDSTIHLASHLREEGRLAALTGDRTGAIKAYEHFLALRPNPDPHLRAEVAHIRAEVARLEERR